MSQEAQQVGTNIRTTSEQQKLRSNNNSHLNMNSSFVSESGAVFLVSSLSSEVTRKMIYTSTEKK